MNSTLLQTALLGLFLAAGNLQAQAAAAAVSKIIAFESATQHQLNSFVQTTNVWHLNSTFENLDSAEPARDMFFGPTVTASFLGFESGVGYELELTFLSDSDNRTVTVTANGGDLASSLVLPHGKVLCKRWPLPAATLSGGELIVEISAQSGPNAVLSSVCIFADKPDAKALAPLPPLLKGKMVACENAALHSLNSFVQDTNVWKLEKAINQIPSREPLREMFFSDDVIKAVFLGAEAATDYGVEVEFLSDSDDRVVSISADGSVLKEKLALPKAQILRKQFNIPATAVKNGRIEISVAKVAGPNAILSGIAIIANRPTARALSALPAAPLPAAWIPNLRLTPRPTDVAGAKATQLDLGGTWKFNPAPPANFWEAATVSSDWKTIQVPGEWVMQGFTVASNTAAAYPGCRTLNLETGGIL